MNPQQHVAMGRSTLLSCGSKLLGIFLRSMDVHPDVIWYETVLIYNLPLAIKNMFIFFPIKLLIHNKLITHVIVLPKYIMTK